MEYTSGWLIEFARDVLHVTKASVLLSYLNNYGAKKQRKITKVVIYPVSNKNAWAGL